MIRAKEIFGLTDCIIVSQRFHIERAIFLARSHGIDAIGFEAEPPRDEVQMMKQLMREKGSRLMAVLDINILKTQPKFLGEKIEIGNGKGN